MKPTERAVSLVDHPDGGYSYVPGIPPYSAGVKAEYGHRIRRITLRDPMPWDEGLLLIDRVLAAADRPSRALCSVELRSTRPHSFGGFGSFNDDYRGALAERGILLDDGVNPIARTNVAPCTGTTIGTEIYAFGFTVPHDVVNRPSFVVSGAGDLHDQADLRPEAVVGGSRSWVESGSERTRVVLDEIERRLLALGLDWPDTDSVVVYSAEAIHTVLESELLPRLGSAARRGVHWHLARPPIEGLRFEMDARGGVEEDWS